MARTSAGALASTYTPVRGVTRKLSVDVTVIEAGSGTTECTGAARRGAGTLVGCWHAAPTTRIAPPMPRDLDRIDANTGMINLKTLSRIADAGKIDAVGAL